MIATLESRMALWLLGLFSVGVYIFQFAPIAGVMLLSFDSSRSGAFPMEGVSWQWYEKLFANDSILQAFQTSIILALGCSLLATNLGVMAAIALVRYQFRAKNGISTLISMPLLVPEVVLGVALLMFLKLMRKLLGVGSEQRGQMLLLIDTLDFLLQHARLQKLRKIRQ